MQYYESWVSGRVTVSSNQALNTVLPTGTHTTQNIFSFLRLSDIFQLATVFDLFVQPTIKCWPISN